MMSMFADASTFNQPIGDWDVSKVKYMERMFHCAENINQQIGDLNVSNVINMSNMFVNASSFNQDISSWDVSSVNSMLDMFVNAISFKDEECLSISFVNLEIFTLFLLLLKSHNFLISLSRNWSCVLISVKNSVEVESAN